MAGHGPTSGQRVGAERGEKQVGFGDIFNRGNAPWAVSFSITFEAIQVRVLPADALEIVSNEEAAQYVGGYLKLWVLAGVAR